jgi:hypothetical protein
MYVWCGGRSCHSLVARWSVVRDPAVACRYPSGDGRLVNGARLARQLLDLQSLVHHQSGM